jgi:hypothetical protein
VSDPSELIFIEEIAIGIFFKRDSREARGESTIIVLRDVGNYGDSGRHLVDVVVRKRYAHGAGADVARRAARWRACWKCTWDTNSNMVRIHKQEADLLFAMLQISRY